MLAGVDSSSTMTLVYQVADGLRMEIAWILAIGVLWIAGRYFGAQRSKDGVTKKGLCAPPKGNKRSASASPAATGARPRAALRATSSPDGPDAAGGSTGTLTDPAWLVPQVTQLCRVQVQRALELYRSALRAGLDLRKVPAEECEQLFMALVTSAIRVRQTEVVQELLKDLRQRGPGVGAGLITSAIKLCTSKQLYAECLIMYDFLAEDETLEVADRSIWSCLLFCTIEAKAYDRCTGFFKRLKARGAPSNKDFGNMVRFASIRGDWKLALDLIQEMQDAGIEVDGVVYNTSLAVCVGGDQLERARELLDHMERIGGVTDVITYNTLMKGYAKASRLDHCFELKKLMCERGVAASQVTYGILLDACINENQVERGAEVFDGMARDGCQMNTVLFTTLLKGLARAGQVDEAMRVYDKMRKEQSITPDLITFSILIKANCDAGRMEAALQLLTSMLDFGLQPDEVIFNNLFGGCVKSNNAALAKRLYGDMVASNVMPSNATFSILIRLYSQCKMLDEAVTLLRTEPDVRHVEPEPRLYSQLIQGCIRERQGRRALEVYKMLLERGPCAAAAHGALSGALGTCVKLNMLDTAVELLSLAAAEGGRVEAREARGVLEAAIRKKKTQCVDACVKAMETLGIPSELTVTN